MTGTNRIMLDLETMGNGSNAAIVAIGAVRFDETGILDRFEAKITLESAVRLGLEMDPGTVIWWLKQEDAARAKIVDGSEDLAAALCRFSSWIGPDAEVWGNGSDFDNVILANAYRAAQLSLPWKFWNNRCYRTLKNLLRHIKLKRVGTHHSAVDDAESQALHLIEILQRLKASA